MNATVHISQNEFNAPKMSAPVFWSVVFHIAVFAFASFGLPFIAPAPEPEEIVFTVELFDLAELPETTKIDLPDNSAEEDAPAPESKPVYNQSATAPDLLSPQAPDIEEPKLEPLPEPVVEPALEPEPVEPEVKPEPALIEAPPLPQVKPKPPSKPKPVEKKVEPKAEKKPEPSPKTEKKAEEGEKGNFDSLLKSLTPNQPDKPQPIRNAIPNSEGSQSQLAPLSSSLSSSEMESFLSGVSPCWNVDAGQIFSYDLVVVLDVTVGPDQRVLSANILPQDQPKYRNNPRFRASADSARRALLDPNCRVLNLPKDKYHLWKEFSFTFNPSGMLR